MDAVSSVNDDAHASVNRARAATFLVQALAQRGGRRCGGFDTHSFQVRVQPLLIGRLAHSVHWFLQALQAHGQRYNVVLFSAGDFGRTLSSNDDGCDHG
jgi:uncharacterized protein (DUF1501 family)